MLCLYLYLIFIPPKDGLFAMPFISWLNPTYLFQTYHIPQHIFDLESFTAFFAVPATETFTV